jgi:Nickel responsive protein SCO4226-like
MPKYVIERSIPGAGAFSPSKLFDISCTSNGVLTEMAPRAQWIHSYVTDDKIYCVYIAENADAVREHAARGGFPADSVSRVHSMIDPTSGEPSAIDDVAGARAK